jgi:hypothetical protein
MRFLRRAATVITSLIGLALLLVLGNAHPGLAQGSTTDLTATPAAITVTVLAQHKSQPVSVAITSSKAVPASDKLGVAMLGDLVRDDSASRIPRSAVGVSITRNDTDSTNESFVLTLTPNLSGIDPGKYSGNVRVTGSTVSPLIVPVAMSIQGGLWYWALLLLLLGLGVGWVLKWYTDTGSKLAAETRRYNSVLRRIGDTPTENIPTFVLDELKDVSEGFSNADQAKVNAALTLLEGQIAGLAAVTNTVGHLREFIDAHTNEVRQKASLAHIPTNERRRVNDALNEAQDLATAKSSTSELLTHAMAITACLQAAGDPEHDNVLDLYEKNRFADGLDEYQKLPASGAPTAPQAIAGAPIGGGAADPARLQSLWQNGEHLQKVLAAPVRPVRRQRRAPVVASPGSKRFKRRAGAAWRTFVGKLVPLIVGLVTVILLAIIGLNTQWSSNLTFGSGGISDYLTLLLWGVGAFVTGKTLSDFLSTVLSRRQQSP